MKRPKVVRLKKPKVDDDDVFIRTLVFVLDMARQGKTKGYALVYDIDDEEGRRTCEAACVLEDEEYSSRALYLLGGIRRMEINFMDRVWGEPNSEKEIG